MGIMERRYQNWDAALGHFEAAASLATPGFCEPFYWVGITRINQGSDVGRGIEVRAAPGERLRYNSMSEGKTQSASSL